MDEKVDRRVQKVAALMQVELQRSVPLHELANLVHLSESRLRHLFKTETGRCPSEFLKALRLQRAKELCAGTFLSIKEIMSSVGIRDPSHFVRDFEKFYGLSPARFRAASALTGNGGQPKTPINSRLGQFFFLALSVNGL